jgi:hypothetical protein
MAGKAARVSTNGTIMDMLKFLAKILAIVLLASCAAQKIESRQTGGPTPKDLIGILYAGQNLPVPEVSGTLPELMKTPVSELRTFLATTSLKPKKIADDLSFNKNYRFVQAYFDNHFMVYQFGNVADKWKDKLYFMSFSLNYPGGQIPEKETAVYQRLVQKYGTQNRIDKFTVGRLNYYIWMFPDVVLTYRAPYFESSRETTAVVEIVDREFYEAKKYGTTNPMY